VNRPQLNGRPALAWVGLGLAIGLLLAACASQTAPPGTPLAPTAAGPTSTMPAATQAASPGTASFKADVLPIFQASCVSCHSGPGAPRGLELSSYASVMKGASSQKVVTPGNPDASPLYQFVASDSMPKGGPPLSAKQKDTIRQWIAAGAPDN